MAWRCRGRAVGDAELLELLLELLELLLELLELLELLLLLELLMLFEVMEPLPPRTMLLELVENVLLPDIRLPEVSEKEPRLCPDIEDGAGVREIRFPGTPVEETSGLLVEAP